MKRVVALLLIASVALFAAVAPQGSLKNAGTPMVKMPTAELKADALPLETANVKTRDINMSKAPALAVDTTVVTLVYLEDFENGANGWTQFDGTAPDPLGVWHLDDFTTGDSLWWCGDYAIGGYQSSWHVALETPEIVLTAGDSTLSFQLDLSVEGSGGEPDGYDGWDGANVQITTDDGATWTVLNPTGIPYNCTSLYSFGYIFNMGPGIPGWGGTQTGDVEVDLGAYIGETVKIRFVFSSDSGYDTNDDGSMYGMFIDSINVAGDAVYNGSEADGLVSIAVNSAKGAYWAVEDRVDSLPSPTHVLRNWVENDTTFARYLEDYYVSPSIALPDEPATLIYCNFEFFADFGDEEGEFPDVDYWRMEVSPDNGVTWNAISNPTGSSTGSNYVYSQRIPVWYDFQSAYGESCNLTDFAGETVKFRFYFRSDEDKPIGQGLLIDDFVVYTQPDLPIPSNVNAVLNAGNVDVAWDNMNGTYQLPKSFMAEDPSNPDVGAYYAPSRTFFSDDSTAGYAVGMAYSTDGKDITFTSLDFALYNVNPFGDSVSIALFGVDTSVNVLYWSDNFVPDTVDGFQSVSIPEAMAPTWNGEFWVLVFWETSGNFPTFYLNTAGTGDMKLYNPAGGFYNAGYTTPIGASGYGEVTYSGLEYSVFRRVTSESIPVEVATGLSTNAYTDEDVNNYVEYEYTVACATPTFTGNTGDGASVFVYPSDVEEAKYDDGTPDAIFTLAMDTTVVVKITPTVYPAKLEAVRFAALYASDVYKIKIFKDDNGMPGDSWLMIEPPVTAISGWNTFAVVNPLTVDNGNGIVLRDGESVWVGVKGATAGDYPAWLAADASSFSGMSAMQAPGGGWTSTAAYLMANPMIRGYFDTEIDTTSIEDFVPVEYALSQNYPNPFNPITTIHFELKESGMTQVDVFDVTGRHVRTLLNGSVDAGAYDLRFDASALSSGVYFYRLTSGSFTAIKKMSLLK